MHQPIIFIFGPSGVGKSHLSNLIKKQNFLYVHIDTDDTKKTFVANGFPSEWDNDFSKVNFDVFVGKLRERLETEYDGVVVSFPTSYRFTKENLDYLRKLGVIPILLWGTEENCKLSAINRMKEKGKKTGRNLNMGRYLDRYDQKNLQTFQLYSRPEYDTFKLEAFRVDGSRFLDEEIKKQIDQMAYKLSHPTKEEIKIVENSPK